MARLPVLDRLPPRYSVVEEGGCVLAWHDDFVDVLGAAGYGPRSRGAFVRSSLAGRQPLRELRPSGGPRLLLRRFTHGGLLRPLTGRRYLDPERPFHELVLSDVLLRNGIATPRVAAAAARRPGFPAGLGWELEIVTLAVEGAVDLGHALAQAQGGRLARAVVRRIVRACGDLVGRMHRAGFLHADLQPNNLLVPEGALAGGEPELTVLDLDRSRTAPHLSDSERVANLERLYRFVARHEERDGWALSPADLVAFLRAYRRVLGAGPEWRDDWRAVTARHLRDRKWHRLGRGLERSLGERRDDHRRIHLSEAPDARRSPRP